MLQAENFEGGGDHHLLLAVVRGRHALEGLEPLQGGLATKDVNERYSQELMNMVMQKYQAAEVGRFSPNLPLPM